MTKGLTLTVAIAILFIVLVVGEEGGPLDKLGTASPNGNIAATEAVAENASAPVVLAETRTPPPPPPPADDMWDWFSESDPAEPVQPAAAAPRQQPVFQGSTTEVGAISRERMNLEE
ncbi:MAG: hypothetical protein WA957_12390 [Alteraurantiacibacter sp.]